MRWVLGLALVLAIAFALAWRDRFDAAALQAWVEGAGAAGPVVFIGLYAVATVLFLPGAVLTLAGGTLFGPLWGTLWNLTGATLGAALAFLIARHLGADWVARRAGPRLQRLNEGVASEGWRFVAFVRLVPLFPFNLLNYALGLTRISFVTYLLSTWVFMLPGAFAYTWLGHAGREALSGGDGLVRNVTIAVSLLAAVALLPRLVRQLRAKPMLDVLDLKCELEAGEGVLLLDVRTVAEFTGDLGHIAQARNLTLEELPECLVEFESRKQRPVRLICRTDRRSAQAARLLAEAGFSDAQVIRGGMTAWRAHGWAVVNA
ncbi:sulfurtransferase [Rubrivivax rivuli]|uniref:TVP38/TMEM64 family membrane protein n=2 Tax=Rubrivivax rivuli TaxID=1862385 RepID=A0A437RIK6_9BURK|nr:sulfurtransferase [Rubrivivax rivuli]